MAAGVVAGGYYVYKWWSTAVPTVAPEPTAVKEVINSVVPKTDYVRDVVSTIPELPVREALFSADFLNLLPTITVFLVILVVPILFLARERFLENQMFNNYVASLRYNDLYKRLVYLTNELLTTYNRSDLNKKLRLIAKVVNKLETFKAYSVVKEHFCFYALRMSLRYVKKYGVDGKFTPLWIKDVQKVVSLLPSILPRM